MHDASPESPAPNRPPRWLERGLETLQDIGFSPHLLERFVKWWRHYGLAKTLVLTLAILGPLLRFEILPEATSSLVTTVAEGAGLRLEVEEWGLSLSEFSATARGVMLKTGGRYREPFLLKADAIAIDASLLQNVTDGVGRLARRIANAGRWVVGAQARPLPPRPVGRAIRVEGGELYLERLISGRGNWQDVAVRTSAPGADEAAVEPYFVPEIELHDFKITYVEHLPAEASSGMEQTLTSSLHLDDVTITIGDFVGPDDPREDPSDFSMDGRLADGRLAITGDFNLWAPSFALDISMNNVGAATLGVLTPEATLVPASGTITGHIRLAVKDDALRECAVNVRFQDVQYRPNPRAPFQPPQLPALERQLATLRLSEPVDTRCMGNWADPNFRPYEAVHASMTARALEDAPPAVASAAAFDRKRFAEALSRQAAQAELQRASEAVTQQVGQEIGEQTGNAVNRGLRSVGRGVGRLFGRKPK